MPRNPQSGWFPTERQPSSVGQLTRSPQHHLSRPAPPLRPAPERGHSALRSGATGRDRLWCGIRLANIADREMLLSRRASLTYISSNYSLGFVQSRSKCQQICKRLHVSVIVCLSRYLLHSELYGLFSRKTTKLQPNSNKSLSKQLFLLKCWNENVAAAHACAIHIYLSKVNHSMNRRPKYQIPAWAFSPNTRQFTSSEAGGGIICKTNK